MVNKTNFEDLRFPLSEFDIFVASLATRVFPPFLQFSCLRKRTVCSWVLRGKRSERSGCLCGASLTEESLTGRDSCKIFLLFSSVFSYQSYKENVYGIFSGSSTSVFGSAVGNLTYATFHWSFVGNQKYKSPILKPRASQRERPLSIGCFHHSIKYSQELLN